MITTPYAAMSTDALMSMNSDEVMSSADKQLLKQIHKQSSTRFQKFVTPPIQYRRQVIVIVDFYKSFDKN